MEIFYHDVAKIDTHEIDGTLSTFSTLKGLSVILTQKYLHFGVMESAEIFLMAESA